jgi:AmmeMemoRadiSam system protein B
VKRIFILGPSHHYYLPGCAVTGHAAYETPLGDLEVDATATAELFSTGAFDTMSVEVDEDEHSIEMHLPYVHKVMSAAQHKYAIVPVLVGSLTPEREAFYGSIFAKYLQDPDTFFIISSDFCHWGERFRYT